MTDLTQPVLVDVADGVATVTLNRPDAMNSLDVRLKLALLDAVRSVAEDDAVRCVVLTGTGRAFCVGQDLKEHIGILQSGDRSALFNTVEEHYNPIVQTLATMPKPVIAGVNGVAAGAGASLAFACDLRVVADSAGFNLAFAGVALSCDTGSSWTLQRLVGRAKALELLYFPRTVGAEEGTAQPERAADEQTEQRSRQTDLAQNGPGEISGLDAESRPAADPADQQGQRQKHADTCHEQDQHEAAPRISGRCVQGSAICANRSSTACRLCGMPQAKKRAWTEILRCSDTIDASAGCAKKAFASDGWSSR
jgi:enoyl-CoA hydratase/carnithine racemase